MKHVIILGHPSERSFAATVADAWRDSARSAGHAVEVRDLYRLRFDPRLQDCEIPRPTGFQPGLDVLEERQAIGGADVFIFVYPLWFYAPPAIVKGYMDRVFGMGFGYGPIHHGENQRLLDGRKMLTFTSSGSPEAWLQSQGDMGAIRRLFDQHFAAVCGLTVVDHIHFGSVLSRMSRETVEVHMRRVRDVFSEHFRTLQ